MNYRSRRHIDLGRYWDAAMSDPFFTSRLRYAVIFAVLLLHLAVIPIAITATLRAYGFEDSLTPRNQSTWTPIIGAQSTLLVLYLTFGAGRPCIRGGLFCVGITCVLVNAVWAYSRLCTFTAPAIEAWIGIAKITSIWLVLPALVSGASLLPMRAALGTVQLVPNVSQTQIRFRIADLFFVTFLVAAILGWYQFVMTDQLRRVFDVRLLAISAGFNVAGALGCLLFVFSRSWWWFGAIVFVASIVARTYWLNLPKAASISWTQLLYPWLIVIATLLVYRVLGYQLHGTVQIPNNKGVNPSPQLTR